MVCAKGEGLGHRPPTIFNYSAELSHSREIGRSSGRKNLGEIRGKKFLSMPCIGLIRNGNLLVRNAVVCLKIGFMKNDR